MLHRRLARALAIPALLIGLVLGGFDLAATAEPPGSASTARGSVPVAPSAPVAPRSEVPQADPRVPGWVERFGRKGRTKANQRKWAWFRAHGGVAMELRWLKQTRRRYGKFRHLQCWRGVYTDNQYGCSMDNGMPFELIFERRSSRRIRIVQLYFPD